MVETLQSNLDVLCLSMNRIIPGDFEATTIVKCLSQTASLKAWQNQRIHLLLIISSLHTSEEDQGENGKILQLLRNCRCDTATKNYTNRKGNFPPYFSPENFRWCNLYIEAAWELSKITDFVVLLQISFESESRISWLCDWDKNFNVRDNNRELTSFLCYITAEIRVIWTEVQRCSMPYGSKCKSTFIETPVLLQYLAEFECRFGFNMCISSGTYDIHLLHHATIPGTRCDRAWELLKLWKSYKLSNVINARCLPKTFPLPYVSFRICFFSKTYCKRIKFPLGGS